MKKINIFGSFKPSDYLPPALKTEYKITEGLLFGRQDLPPRVIKILNQYGNVPIVSGEICRYGIPSYLNTVANYASFGEFEKNNPYDKLFHLSIVFKLNNGLHVLVEKNEVINISTSINQPLDTERLFLDTPNGLTLNEVIKRTEERMGKEKFINYSANNNNCQNFILNILQANNMATNENTEFVKQNTEQLFKNLSYLRKFTNFGTDLASRIDVLKQGGSITFRKSSKQKGISRKNGLYSNQIEQILKHKKDFNGVFMRDELPKVLKKGWYVMNMDTSNHNGTHWICFKYDPKLTEYYDALSGPPPIEVMQRTKGQIVYNKDQIQNEKSTACGWFCISLILSDNHKGTSVARFQKYLEHFSNNTEENDNILQNILLKEF